MKVSGEAQITILFSVGMPHARWGPLFHVFRLEQPHVRLEWRPAGYPVRGRSVLEDADVGLLLEPPRERGLRGLTIDESPMIVIVAAGDPLGHRDELCVADILDRPFPGRPSLNSEWTSFWTLDHQRGGPPAVTDDDVRTAEHELAVVAAGRAIATAPAWAASGLAHPGVIALPLRDAPPVRTRLGWRADDDAPPVQALVDLAIAWTQDGRGRHTLP
jgi:DNA-binding transcriptional LysR family regulator